MLKTTYELIEYLKSDTLERESAIICSLVNSIIKCGDKSDADEILNQYLVHPFDFDNRYLFPIFKAFGDRSIAEQIFNISIHNNKLVEDADPEILEVVSYLQYGPMKPILADYIFGNSENSDYYLSKCAALGLLHFDCSEYQKDIETEIEKCYGKNIFPEFVPALVAKLKNPRTILEKLFELGNQLASTDCNAGIVLGFSLCGEQGETYFRKVLFDRSWDVNSTATGTIYFAYEGLKNLGITFRELYNEIKKISDKENLEYCLDVFFALLERKFDDIKTDPEESFTEIYKVLFQWKNESDNIIHLAQAVNKEQEVYHLKKLIEIKMNEEYLLKNYVC
ncbi:hypothetical protein [Chryseobacterium sp. JK1]|uniref:hypothetical protein n=1 Tax=Chryseobacterium sp. JK1 TaxID=874294 RepID=UPI003D69FDFF